MQPMRYYVNSPKGPTERLRVSLTCRQENPDRGTANILLIPEFYPYYP